MVIKMRKVTVVCQEKGEVDEIHLVERQVDMYGVIRGGRSRSRCRRKNTTADEGIVVASGEDNANLPGKRHHSGHPTFYEGHWSQHPSEW